MSGRAKHGGSIPPASLGADALEQARREREAVERFWQTQAGVPAGVVQGEPDTAAARRRGAAEQFRERGAQLLGAGRLPAAIAALRRATEHAPRDAAARHLLGQAFLRSGRLDEAADNLRLAVTLQDDLANAHRDLAVALDRQELGPEVMAAYRKAVQMIPDWTEGHRRLAELLEDSGDFEEAARELRSAASAAPDTPAGRQYLIGALTLEGKFSEAEAELRQAILLDPNNDLLHRLLADSLSKQGRFDEAIDFCDRALAVNPLQVPAHLVAVYARKCTEADRPRLERMLSTLQDPALGDPECVFLHHAIGKLLDDLGEYCGAMRHFDQANRIKCRTTTFDRALSSAQIDRLMERFTAAFFAGNADFAVDDETPLLIVGMPRSGTTLVEQILSSHPQIAAGGELLFWRSCAVSPAASLAAYLTAESAREMARNYLALLGRIGPSAARVTDKMPLNLFHLGLVHLLLPKARIIHCRRNPVDTCLSIYFSYFKAKFEFAYDKADLAFAYRQYARLMDHWRMVLPPERFLEVDYEALIVDREAVTRRLVGFTGLDWHDACMSPERNRRVVTTSSVWQVRQPVYATSVERWRRYEPWLGELRQLLPPAETSNQSPEPAA